LNIAAQSSAKQFGEDVISVSEQNDSLVVTAQLTRSRRRTATVKGDSITNVLSWYLEESGISNHLYTLDLVGDREVLASSESKQKTPEDVGREILEYVTKDYLATVATKKTHPSGRIRRNSSCRTALRSLLLGHRPCLEYLGNRFLKLHWVGIRTRPNFVLLIPSLSKPDAQSKLANARPRLVVGGPGF
jgi:hypothetical protein